MNYIKNGYEGVFDELTNLIEDFYKRGVPGNDCVVYHHGELVYGHSCGYSDFESKTPLKGDELYNIYSCSKVLTCAAALQLWEKGYFHLDDELSKYMPEFENMTIGDDEGTRPAENKITIRHLFTMTAGFDYDINCQALMRAREDTDGKCPTLKTIEYMGDAKLKFEPGTSWLYSLCHDVLGGLIVKLTGMTLNEYVSENIFKPLGMTKTTYLLPDDKLPGVASQYILDVETKELTDCGKGTRCYKLGSEYESGGAGIVTCMDDYMKFIEAMRKGDIILKKETIDLMQTNQLDGEPLAAYQSVPGRGSYGYGLGVRCPRTEEGPQDFGWGGAAGAYTAIDRELDYTLFYLQHVFGSPIPDAVEKIKISTVANKCILKL